MERIDFVYKEIARKGILLLRESIRGEHGDWMKAEVEMLHNVPALIGESSPTPHKYYYDVERVAYAEEIERLGGRPAEFAGIYDDLWEELGRILKEKFPD